ncbi:MAG: class I mannose-6-phosphate isomerase [Planctomycetales bacterium]
MLYPLRFQPLLKRYLWGGRRLQSDLNKTIGEGEDYAESWEIVDHGADQSVVNNGPLAGTTLSTLVQQHGTELLGRHHPQANFPLLFKFLDANKDLSVQVHPDDNRAARLQPPDRGKTEAWIVLAVEDESVIYAGLQRGCDRQTLEQEIERGSSPLCLHQFQPKPGDCFYLPAGTVHALGKGLLVAEIQQASNTTYRLYDWDRLGSDGQPRQLHIDQALDAIDFSQGPIEPQIPTSTDRPGVERLVTSDVFCLDRLTIDEDQRTPVDNRCHIIAVLSGELTIEGDPTGEPLIRGQTALLPASPGGLALQAGGRVTLLDAYLP